jgi:hypothetical protein
MSEDPASPGEFTAHLRDVRDALRSVLDEQMHTIDQLLQRSAILLGAASVLAGLLAATPGNSATPTWRQYTTGIAFAALIVSLFAGIVAVWPRQVKQQSLPSDTPPDGAQVAGVQTYASMAPEKFLRLQCDDAYTTMTTGGYTGIISFRRSVFRIQTVALVIGGVLIGLNGLSLTLSTPPPHESTNSHPPSPVPSSPAPEPTSASPSSPAVRRASSTPSSPAARSTSATPCSPAARPTSAPPSGRRCRCSAGTTHRQQG